MARWPGISGRLTVHIRNDYMAELVHGEKEHSDWFPEACERSEFCYTDC